MLKYGDYIVNAEGKKEAVILLFGQIGFDVDGTDFAKEVEYLANSDIVSCKIKINSVGGSVFQGYSILAAIDMLREKGKEVQTENVGVAYSMAGIILACGDKGKRSAVDYATVMIHDPKFVFGSSENDSQKMMLNKITDALSMIIQSNTNLTPERTRELMGAETTFNADESLTHGFVDEIRKTGKTIKPVKNSIELMVACADLYKQPISNLNKLKMSKVNEILGLHIDAAENSTVEAVTALIGKASQVQALIDEKTALENKVNLLTVENTTLKKEGMKTKATSLINEAVEAGKIQNDSKDMWIENAMTDFDGTKKLIDSLTGTPGKINNMIQNDATDAAGLAVKYDEIMNRNPKEFETMPQDEYNTMLAAWEAREKGKMKFEKA